MPSSVDLPTWKRYRSWSLAHDLAPSTAEKSARYLRYFERAFGLRLDGLSQDGDLEFLAGGRERGVKPKTLNSWVRELNLWSRFREFGWRMPYYRRRGHPIIQVPSDKEVRALRSLRWSDPSADARNRALIALLSDLGPRRNEIVHMDLADRQRTTTGEPLLVVRFGKGEKERTLFIDRSTDQLLEGYVASYRIRSHPRALFTTRGGRLSYGYLGRIVTEAGMRVGIPWLSAHKLRHWSVDSLLDAGVSVPSVAEAMGHARWETTALYRSRRLQRARSEQEIRAAGKARFGGCP